MTSSFTSKVRLQCTTVFNRFTLPQCSGPHTVSNETIRDKRPHGLPRTPKKDKWDDAGCNDKATLNKPSIQKFLL